MRVPFIGGSNTSRSVSVSAQRTVNMYAELDPEAEYQAAMFSRPGLATWANMPTAECRGMVVFAGELYVVNGADLFKVSKAKLITTIGSLSTSTGRVAFAANPTQLMLVDGSFGYTTDGSTLTKITDGDFPNGSAVVVHMDGYFIITDPDNAGRFYISNLSDGTAWTATDFATAVRNPDNLVSLLVLDRFLLLLGEDTTEPWWDSGAADFPFESMESGLIEWGCVAAHSAVKTIAADGAVAGIWLARNASGDNVVMSYPGGRVSNHAVETAFAGFSTVSDAHAWTMQMRGHTFYVLTFPTEAATWVLDLSTGLWAEWKSYGIDRFRGAAHAFFDGQHLIGDYQGASLFELRFDQYTDAGAPLERIRDDRFISVDRRRLFHRRFELECESGVGTADLDPQVVFQWSDDGGHQWSNEHWDGLGKVGKYEKRAFIKQLGSSRKRVYRSKFTDDAPFTIISGHLDVMVGSG